jgi:hypothetical protein
VFIPSTALGAGGVYPWLKLFEFAFINLCIPSDMRRGLNGPTLGVTHIPGLWSKPPSHEEREGRRETDNDIFFNSSRLFFALLAASWSFALKR